MKAQTPYTNPPNHAAANKLEQMLADVLLDLRLPPLLSELREFVPSARFMRKMAAELQWRVSFAGTNTRDEHAIVTAEGFTTADGERYHQADFVRFATREQARPAASPIRRPAQRVPAPPFPSVPYALDPRVYSRRRTPQASTPRPSSRSGSRRSSQRPRSSSVPHIDRGTCGCGGPNSHAPVECPLAN